MTQPSAPLEGLQTTPAAGQLKLRKKMDGYEESLSDLSFDEDGVCMQVDEQEEPENNEKAEVLSVKEVYEMMQGEVEKICEVTNVSE